MNKDVIDFKEFEYLGRSGAAAMQGRLPQAKRDVTTLLVLYRLQSRAASQELTEKREEMRALYRSLRKAVRRYIVSSWYTAPVKAAGGIPCCGR